MVAESRRQLTAKPTTHHAKPMFRQVKLARALGEETSPSSLVKNTSNLLDFVATWRCQANPRLSGIIPLSLLELVTLRILPSLRFKARTLYSYSTIKVQTRAFLRRGNLARVARQNLPSSAERGVQGFEVSSKHSPLAFQLASRINSFELIQLSYNT